MTEVVGGLAMSHAPGMTGWQEQLDEAEYAIVYGAVGRARELVAEAAPTLIVAFLDDHFDNHYRNLMPTLSVPVADGHTGPGPWAEMLRIDEESVVASRPERSEALLRGLVAADFDVTRMGQCRYGNNLMVPLHLVLPALDVPVVPVFINVFSPPLISTRRALDLGRVVRAIVDDWDERVLFLGTGGLSHWPPIWAAERPDDDFLVRMKRYQTIGPAAFEDDPNVITDIGPYELAMAAELGEAVVNPEWDRRFLELLAAGDTDTLATWTYDDVEQGGGHGGHEILNWLAVAGAMGGGTCDVLAYSPTVPFICGTGLAWYPAISA